MSRAEQKRKSLRDGLTAAEPLVVLGAHDAMSARLIENAGFGAVWVSGFGVSTMAHALPDMNLITMSEALGAAKRIDDACSVPVIADCDNGYGGLINVVRTVTEYERAGISGICVEDNLFPKRNSLFRGETKRELIPADEQARRIRAGKSAQETSEFVFIARVEALIAGHGVTDACDRAEAYAPATDLTERIATRFPATCWSVCRTPFDGSPGRPGPGATAKTVPFPSCPRTAETFITP